MTPEERFTKIENFLSTVAEHQAEHAEQISELREVQKGMATAITGMQESMAIAFNTILEAQRATDQKLNTLAETVAGLTETVAGLAETVGAVAEQQQITEEKLHALIDTVDRIIRSQSGQR